jgi:hypothetical protein
VSENRVLRRILRVSENRVLRRILRVSENRVLRRIFELSDAGRRKLDNEELHNLYSLQHTSRRSNQGG